MASVAPGYDALKKEANSNPSSGISTLDSSLKSRAHSLQIRADVGYALFGLAGVLAVTDIALWVAATKTARREESYKVTIAPQLGGLVIAGRF